MPATLLEKDIKAITIEYKPTEEELSGTTLVVGKGLLDRFRITEELGYKTYFGVRRYLTGLDPELIQNDSNLSEEERKEKIADIRRTLDRLEKFFGIRTLDATNDSFWSKVKLDITRKTTNLDLTNPMNELLVYCIKGGGFTQIAKSYEESLSNAEVKFYLVEPVEFVENRVAPRKIVTKAKALLYDINEKKSFDDLFFLAKYIMPVEKAYTKTTPKSLMFEDLDKYIDGEIVRKPKTECASYFIEATKKTKLNMIANCIVKDAVYFAYIYTNPAGELKNNETGGVYGTTMEKAVEHLLSPAYQHELDNIKDRVEKKWLE